MKSFADYSENKDFNTIFSLICENIVLSGVPFEQYWEKCGLPIIIESDKHSNEIDLLNEFNWKSSTLNPGNWFGGNKSSNAWDKGSAKLQMQRDPNYQHLGATNLAKQQSPDDYFKGIDAQEAAKKTAMQKKLAAYQGQIDQSLSDVKQQFSQNMRQFLKSAGDSSMQSGNKVSYMVAQKFYDKIMKIAQPVIDQYAISANSNKPNDQQQQMSGNFDKGSSGMQQSQQQDLKSGLQQKYPPADVVRAGFNRTG